MNETKKWKRYAGATLIALGIWTLISVGLALRLDFDYNFENFFPQDDPETSFFLKFREVFESDNDYIIVALENHEGVFRSDFLKRVDALVSDLAALPNVDTVVSPTRMVNVSRDPLVGTVFTRPMLRLDNDTHLLKDSALIWERGELLGTLFAEDGRSLALQINHRQFLSKLACDTLSAQVEMVLERSTFDGKHAVGRALGQVYYVETMQRELAIFMSLGVLLIILFLWVAFRSAWGIWVPISVVLLSVVWVLGWMKLVGKPIDLMLIVLPTIIFVVGMSDVVHILTRYYEELRKGYDKLKAIGIAFREVGLATLLTSITTAIGFLTLITSSIQPISSFGVTTATGVFIAFFLAFTMLPSVIILSPRPNIDISPNNTLFWTRQLHNALRWTIRNRKKVMLVSAGVLVMSFAGMLRIDVNNYLLEDLRDNDPLKQEFVYFEENFSGARPFELAVLVSDSVQIFDREVLLQLDRVDSFLINRYEVGSLFSPARIVKTANRELKGGANRHYVIPADQKDIDRLVQTMQRFDRDNLLGLFVNQEAGLARVQGKTGDLGARAFAEKNRDLDAFVNTLPNRSFDIRITGTATLVDLNNESLAVDMTIGLAIAFLVVSMIIGILFKSARMVLICLVPNVMPLIMIAGFMGFAGIDLKVSTSIIFTIAFGIAVDDTIHYMSKLKLELAKGKSLLYALKRTQLSTGKAIIVTSIILCAGFLTLIMSGFLGTFYIGLLVSMTLLFAVLADVFLLPVLIILFFAPKKKNPPVELQ